MAISKHPNQPATPFPATLVAATKINDYYWEMLFVPTIFAICTHPRDFTHPRDRIPYENTISM
jgi:hypothetical protein